MAGTTVGKIKREPGNLYFVDKDGNVKKTPLARGKKKKAAPKKKAAVKKKPVAKKKVAAKRKPTAKKKTSTRKR